MEQDYWISLAKALQHNTRLQDLTLDNVGFGDQPMCALAKSLVHNTTLSLLDLSRNHIGDVGRRVFLDHLSSMRGLKELEFGDDSPSVYYKRTRKDQEYATQIAGDLERANNYVLEKLSYMDDMDKSERFYLDLNKYGRRLLMMEEEVPIGLWPLVLSQLAQDDDNVHLLHYFLCQKLDLLATVATHQPRNTHEKWSVRRLRKRRKRSVAYI